MPRRGICPTKGGRRETLPPSAWGHPYGRSLYFVGVTTRGSHSTDAPLSMMVVVVGTTSLDISCRGQSKALLGPSRERGCHCPWLILECTVGEVPTPPSSSVDSTSANQSNYMVIFSGSSLMNYIN